MKKNKKSFIIALIFLSFVLNNCAPFPPYIKKTDGKCTEGEGNYVYEFIPKDSSFHLKAYYSNFSMDSLFTNSNTGAKSISRFKNGYPHGISEFWWESGQLRYKTEYFEGNEIIFTRKEYDVNGNTASHWDTLSGSGNANYKSWYSNGNKKRISHSEIAK